MTRIPSTLRRLAVAFVIGAPSAMPAAAQTPFEPAAIVNDSVVTQYDVAQRARLLIANGAPQDRAGDLALEQLIEDRIRTAAARRQGLTPTAGTVESGFADYAAQRGLTAPQLESALNRAGIDRATVEEAVTAEIVWRELVRQRFGPRAEPAEAELDQELAIAAAGPTRSVRLQEIALPFAARGEAETRALADDLIAQLQGGADFAALARRRSASPTAARGGDVGWIAEAGLPLELAGALSDASPGQVVGPVDIQGGVAIIRLNEVREEAPVEGAQDTLVLALVQGPRAGVARIAEGNPSCDEALAQAEAAGLSARRSDPTPFGALQPLTREAVGGLQPGANSGPIEAQGAAVAFFVCDRISGASPEAREALRARVRAERLNGFAAGYLQELRNDAVIEIR